jgi:hypothetical protein
MRPVCFVVTPEKQQAFTSWCNDYTPAFQYNVANIHFWCFSFSYCDRSNWNAISDDVKRDYFTIPDTDREYIQQLPTSYALSRTYDTSSSDDDSSTRSSDEN